MLEVIYRYIDIFIIQYAYRIILMLFVNRYNYEKSESEGLMVIMKKKILKNAQSECFSTIFYLSLWEVEFPYSRLGDK